MPAKSATIWPFSCPLRKRAWFWYNCLQCMPHEPVWFCLHAAAGAHAPCLQQSRNGLILHLMTTAVHMSWAWVCSLTGRVALMGTVSHGGPDGDGVANKRVGLLITHQIICCLTCLPKF